MQRICKTHLLGFSTLQAAPTEALTRTWWLPLIALGVFDCWSFWDKYGAEDEGDALEIKETEELFSGEVRPRAIGLWKNLREFGNLCCDSVA